MDLHKTKEIILEESLKEKLKADKVAPNGQIYFELEDLDYWTKKLDLKRASYEYFQRRSNGQFDFFNSFLKVKSPKLNYREFKKSGIPSENILIRFEFKTEDKDAPLLSINNAAGDCDYDTHVFLRNGKVAFQVGEPPLFLCAGESSLADNKWHRLEVFCLTDQETRMMVDGKLGQGNLP